MKIKEHNGVKGLIVGTDKGEAWLKYLADTLEEKEKARRKMILCADPDVERLQDVLKKWTLEPLECLCIVQTDQAALASKKLGIPCIGYENPEISGQALKDVTLLLQGFDEIDWQFLDQVHTRELGLPVQIAETEHLQIREMCMEDLDVLYELYEEEEVRRYVTPLDLDREEQKERFRAYIRYMYGLYQFGMWMVIEKKSGAVIGRVGYGLADYEGDTKLDLGYLIGAPWRKKGYAVEACKAVLAYGKERLGFNVVSAYIHPENLSSLVVIRKLGFAEKDRILVEGEWMVRFEKELCGM